MSIRWYKKSWWRVAKKTNTIWISPIAYGISWVLGEPCPVEIADKLREEGCPTDGWHPAARWIQDNCRVYPAMTDHGISIPLSPAPVVDPVPVIREEPRLVKLIKAAKLSGLGLYLYGEAGVGKSYGIEQAAQSLGLKFYTSGACLDDIPLKGYKDANGVYQETQLYKAVTQGGLFLLDEMDVCSSEVLLTLNQLLANRTAEFGGELVKAHPDFIFCATGNTDLNGGTEDYNGRQIIDKSFKTRFICEKIEYNRDVAISIAGESAVAVTTKRFGKPINYRALKEFIGLTGAGFGADEAMQIIERSLVA